MSKRIDPIVGEKFGWFEVISDEIKKEKDNHVLYLVRCKCGEEKWRSATNLRQGKSHACRFCAAKEKAKKYPPKTRSKYIGLLNATFYTGMRGNARRRGLEFSVSQEFLWELFERQGRKCALSGIDLKLTTNLVNGNQDWKNTTASLDRIDSSKGYIENNVQWVHKDINYMKNDYDQDYFIAMCKAIAENHGSIYDD